MTTYTVTQTDGVVLTPSRTPNFGWSIGDSFTIHPVRGTIMSWHVVNVQNLKLTHTQRQVMSYLITTLLELADTNEFDWTAGGVLIDLIKLTGQPLPSLSYGFTQSDLLTVIGALSAGRPVHLAENLTFGSTASTVMGILLTQHIKLRDATLSNAAYGLALAELIYFNSALFNFATLQLTDGLNLHGAIPTFNYTASVALTQNLAITSTLARQMVFQVTSAEELELTDVEIVNMIYQGDPLQDNLLITALYISPDGNFTTWAINTRTNAITEYQNWAFNSFATFGRKYIGANSSGIFELNGERDETTNIVATLQNGYMQMGGTRLAGLKGAYIAARGEGQWLMKLTAGDGREYTYQFQLQPNLMTTRIQVGKGLRSRFFSCTLQNIDGQDFDLESLEFVPILSTRRV